MKTKALTSILVISAILSGCQDQEATPGTSTTSTSTTTQVSISPNDDFSSWNFNRWYTVNPDTGSFGVTSNGVFAFVNDSNDVTVPQIAAKFKVQDDLNLTVDMKINSVNTNGAYVALVLPFTDRVGDMIEVFLERTSGGVNQLKVLDCVNYTCTTAATVAAPGYQISLQVLRDRDNITVKYNEVTAYTVALSGKPVSFDGPSRPSIIFSNTSAGTVDVEVDNWDVHGNSVIWD